MRRATLLFLFLAACGGGGTVGELAAPAAPTVHSITGPLDAAGGTPFTITGEGFPGAVTDTVMVRFTATAGSPFDGCRSATLERPALLTSPTTILGASPATVLVGNATCTLRLVFPGGIEVAAPGVTVEFTGTSDVANDHDLDGLHDRCDPDTYDFEDDAPGTRPAGTSAVIDTTPGFEVGNGTPRGARYADALAAGAGNTLDRLACDYARQDLTAYVDFDDTPQWAHVEFWSDGSYRSNSGAGLLLQVLPAGELRLYFRARRSLSVTLGPQLPASGRIRVRLVKGAADSSTMHVDAWVGGAWTDDHAVFPIADDRWLSGRQVALAEYGNSSRGIERITVLRHAPPDPLHVIQNPRGSADWKLFQRNGSDVATIPVHAFVRLAASGRLEARVVEAGTTSALPGHDWSDHTLALAAADPGRVHLDVAEVPTGGNYDVHVRLLDAATEDVLGEGQLSEVAVGDVYLCIGQSNMSGYSHSLAGATVPIPEAHLFANSDTWMQGVEPMDGGAYQRDGRSAENPAHTLMLPFATSLVQATGVPVGIIPAPLGGTNLYSQWQRYAPDPDHRNTLYGSALRRAALQGGTPLRGILWYQGESDSINGRTQAQYLADLEQLVAQYRDDLAAPDAVFLCVQLGTWSAGGYPNWTNIQEAQRQVCRNDPLAALATVHDQPRSDGIHYSVAGYQEVGRRLAEQARVLVFGHAIDPLTELVEAVSVAAGSAIELRYDAGVSGGQASLFQVADGLGINAVNGVASAGNTVTLQLARPLSGAATVRYGMSANPAVAWVFDTNGVAVPAFGSVSVTP